MSLTECFQHQFSISFANNSQKSIPKEDDGFPSTTLSIVLRHVDKEEEEDEEKEGKC